MELFLLFLFASALAAKDAPTDWLAARRGDPVPSVEKRKLALDKQQRRHDRKNTRKASTDDHPLGVVASVRNTIRNSLERTAVQRDARQQGKLRALEDDKPNLTEAACQRKTRRIQQKREFLEAAARGRGVVWDKTKNTAETIRARRAEAKERRENERRDDLGLDIVDSAADDTDQPPEQEEITDGPDATVLQFRRPDRFDLHQPDLSGVPTNPLMFTTYRDGSGAFTQLAVRRVSPDEQLGPDGPQITGDPDDPSTWRGNDRYGRDIQTGRGQTFVDEYGLVHDSDELLLGEDVSPERRLVRQYSVPTSHPTGPTEPDSTDSDATPSRRFSEINTKGLAMTTTDTTTGGEITNLTEAITYTGEMSEKLQALQAQMETLQAELTELAESCETADTETEQAAASLRTAENEGDHVDAFDRARDNFAPLADSLREAASTLGTAGDSLASSAEDFSASKEVFEQQVGLQEQYQALESEGIEAGTKDFVNA